MVTTTKSAVRVMTCPPEPLQTRAACQWWGNEIHSGIFLTLSWIDVNLMSALLYHLYWTLPGYRHTVQFRAEITHLGDRMSLLCYHWSVICLRQRKFVSLSKYSRRLFWMLCKFAFWCMRDLDMEQYVVGIAQSSITPGFLLLMDS